MPFIVRVVRGSASSSGVRLGRSQLCLSIFAGCILPSLCYQTLVIVTKNVFKPHDWNPRNSQAECREIDLPFSIEVVQVSKIYPERSGIARKLADWEIGNYRACRGRVVLNGLLKLLEISLYYGKQMSMINSGGCRLRPAHGNLKFTNVQIQGVLTVNE